MPYRPYTLIAELTYRCPLHCPYCSNPAPLQAGASELLTSEWCRIFTEAEALGVMQLHLTGGEPLVRSDLESLVRKGSELGLYTNLITAGVPLSRERLRVLHAQGLSHVQLSLQDAVAERSDRIAGHPAFHSKIEVARWVKEAGLALTLNIVLHRANLDHVAEMIALAERLGADRLELANTQYLGWALGNRQALLPAAEELDGAFAVASEARARLRDVMEIIYVTPDYYSTWPKACMEGWARRFLLVEPSGMVLPCHAAHTIPGIRFENARDKPLSFIWNDSPGMNLFRGEAWMSEPCRGCARRTIDFGGCRCQAFHLAGDASLTDPACSLSPAHGWIESAREAARAGRGEPFYLYRGPSHRSPSSR